MVRRVLHVAEKPSVAKEIAKVLSKSQNPGGRAGLSQYNRIYEFPHLHNGTPSLYVAPPPRPPTLSFPPLGAQVRRHLRDRPPHGH